MKNHFSAVSKLVAAAVCALSLGSCSRAEYAMLPKGASYHGVARAATPVPAATPATAIAPTAAPAVETTATLPSTEAVATAALATAAAPAKEVAVAPAAGHVTPVATATTTPAPKLSLVQRLAISKLTHKVDKMMQKSGAVRAHDNTASTAKGGISGNLRTGLILLLIGILVGLIPNLGLVGTIIAIIGIVFIVLWLLDQL